MQQSIVRERERENPETTPAIYQHSFIYIPTIREMKKCIDYEYYLVPPAILAVLLPLP
jgi:hypothetical protein